MIDWAAAVPIQSNVLIAPHHGADNASSTPFINAVHPQYVVFSAGHNASYRHPRATTAQRYIDLGVAEANMFRTDRGDDEGPDEWAYLRVAGPEDKPGDDDVDILIRSSGELIVDYRHPVPD